MTSTQGCRGPEMLSIRQLAARTAVSSKTLRYWESRVLLPRPERTHTGYRMYPESTIRRVEFIRKAKGIGFTLSEIRSLIGLAQQKGTSCDVVEAWARQKLETLDRQISILTRLRNELAQRRRRWQRRLPCPPLSPDEICCLIEQLPSSQPSRERR